MLNLENTNILLLKLNFFYHSGGLPNCSIIHLEKEEGATNNLKNYI